GVTTVEGGAFQEILDPYPGSRVLGRFESGDPAIIENSFGRGKAILIGSFTALGYDENPDSATQKFLVSLAGLAGVSAPVTVSGAPGSTVEVRRLVGKDEQIVFAFNESESPVDVSLQVDAGSPIGHAVNWDDNQEVPFRQSDGKVTLHKDFASREVWVVDLQAR
ncbi:MAG: hypothetical protein WBD93_21970, partial [Acidobacteriaceae bacterium]